MSKKETPSLHDALAGLVAALPRCRDCTNRATCEYDNGDRYCDVHGAATDGETDVVPDNSYATPLRIAIAALKENRS